MSYKSENRAGTRNTCARQMSTSAEQEHTPALYASGITSGECNPSVQIDQSVKVLCELAGDVAGGEAMTLATDLDHRHTDNQFQRA